MEEASRDQFDSRLMELAPRKSFSVRSNPSQFETLEHPKIAAFAVVKPGLSKQR